MPAGPCDTRAVEPAASSKTSAEELSAFEVATRDLVGVALSSVEQIEVSLSQYRLLLVLQSLGRASSTQCAEALGVAGSSVTRLADRLHASGHLLRGVDPDNRSAVTLELTGKPVTIMFYMAGLGAYAEQLREAQENDYPGFRFTTTDRTPA